MATITLKSTCPIEAPDPDSFNFDLYDDKPWKRTLPLLLIKLGQKLIEHGHHQDPDNWWLSLAQVSAYCRRYNLSWQGSTKGKDLECPAMDLFAKAGDIRGNGVKIEHKVERIERKRRPCIFLKFTKLYPDGTCA